MTESYETVVSWVYHGGETVKENLLRRSIPEPNSGCWIWTEGCSGDGYGAVNIRRRVHEAHRVSYMVFKGRIPDGLNLLHKFDNTFCINPDHLSPGTPAENNHDRHRKGRSAVRAKNGNAKLSEEDVAEIRATAKRNHKIYGNKPLADKFGIKPGHVWKIVHNRLWIEGEK